VPSGPAADLTEFNRAHIEVGEIATVLDLRFAEGANFDETNARR
jgi:hypothetical protein